MFISQALAAGLLCLGTVSAVPNPRWGGYQPPAPPAPSVPAVSTVMPGPADVAESHVVKLVNRCGSGRAVFLYRDNATFSESTTITGPLYGGVAWMDGYKDTNCGPSGIGCGTVEFSLINPGKDKENTQNSINYSLQSMGDHQFKYPMNFAYTGGCSAAAPKQCVAATDCQGAFWGTDPFNGTPVNCLGNNAGITITFC